MLDELRKKLDQINLELVELIKRRLGIVREIAELKKEKNLPIFQPQREEELKRQIRMLGEKEGVDSEFLEKLLALLIEHSKTEQKGI